MTATSTTARPLRLQTGHVGLNVVDLDRSLRFYQDVFGFVIVSESSEAGRRFAFLGDGDRLVLTLWEQSSGAFDPARPGLHHLSFQAASIDDVRTFERRLRDRGSVLLHDGVVPHGEGADSGGIFFVDPDGTRLEIFSPTGAAGRPAPIFDAPTCGFF